jgi:hypothetical protein
VAEFSVTTKLLEVATKTVNETKLSVSTSGYLATNKTDDITIYGKNED